MTYIFESPDKGKTVYRRCTVTGQRVVHSKVVDPRDTWEDIAYLAETNESLREALNQLLVVYRLVKDHVDN